MLLRLSLIVALTSASALANQRNQAGCCTSDSGDLSPKTIKALLYKTEPVSVPCCAERLHIKGTMVLSIAVGTDGSVTCVEYISGHPLIIGVAIDSVRQWRFRPYVVREQNRKFCGRVALRYEATENGVKYSVVQAPKARDPAD